MKIEQDQINDWARLADKTTDGLVDILYHLGDHNVVAAVAATQQTQAIANRLRLTLLAAGADDPTTPRPRMQADIEAHAPDLADMTSPANKRLARLLREAAEAAAVVEQERGEDGGLSEVLAGYAERRDLECYGPIGLREG